jgi:SAM-dependent methyltransferase
MTPKISPLSLIETKLDCYLDYLRYLTAKGGLDPEDYPVFEKWLSQMADDIANGKLSIQDIEVIRDAFGSAMMTTKTLQGHVFLKPRGYAGDFEIIDKIYCHHVAEKKYFADWDLYFHSTAAVQAVRNRKTYFIELLKLLEKTRLDSKAEKFDVLNIASGSGRDIQEFFLEYPENGLFFDCLDLDANAINFAQNLCSNWLSQIHFKKTNALRFSTDKKYRLIWSAGLFDYFNDKTFKFLLKRYFSMLDVDGEIVIGNFSDNNPNRTYMELGEWFLNHRSESELLTLVEECELSASSVFIGQEPLGVNLFLHIKK